MHGSDDRQLANAPRSVWNAIAHTTPYAGLEIVSSNFPAGFSSVPPSFADPYFSPLGQLAVTGQPDLALVGALELDRRGLRAITWEFDAGAPSSSFDAGVVADTSIPSPAAALTGPLGAGTCPNGFGYLAMTDGGLFVAETDFDGRLISDAGGLFVLDDFEAPVASMAVTSSPAGGLLMAVSSPGQIAVYFAPCK